MTETENRSRDDIRRTGTVQSDRMDKTIVVRIERRVMHPVYKKYVRRYTKLVAHDENNEAHDGDIVEVAFGRPMSKTKRWRLVKVVTQAAGGAS